MLLTKGSLFLFIFTPAALNNDWVWSFREERKHAAAKDKGVLDLQHEKKSSWQK